MTDVPGEATHRLLVEDLLVLADGVPPAPPATAAAIADAVLARLPAADAHHAQRGRTPLRRPLLTVAAGVVAVLAALLAAPPVRAAIEDWFGFGGVRVRITPNPAPTTAPPPPTVGAHA